MRTKSYRPPLDDALRARTAVLYEAHRERTYRDTDRLFMYFFIFQWLACVFCALWISPRTWVGTTSSVHMHVWAAIFLGGLITLFPALLAFARPGRKETRYVIAVSQMLVSALLIDLTGGRIETHFHVFGSLAILAFYRDWRVLVPATIVVAFDHWLRGVYWPQSVYGILTPEPWRWVEHAGWVIFEDVFLVISCLRSQKEMREIALRKARDEKGQQIIEARVIERTAELRESEQRFRHSEKMGAIGQLAGGIAHDLNNGLTPILGYLDYVLEDVRENDPTYAPLSAARQAARRCAEVVEKILAFSRPSPQQQSAFKIDRLLQEHARLLKSLFPATIDIKVGDAGAECVYGNEADLLTVLMNLAVNAKDAMSSGPGVYRVEARGVRLCANSTGEKEKQDHPEKEYVLLAVSDTGCGMPPEILQRIYEPFFTTKVKRGGTGLGLTMVFKIVKDHGGWVDVSSAPGKGTLFQIYLPVCDPVLRDPSEETSNSAALPKRNETILLVDDEETIRNMGREFLTRMGCRVLTAGDGEEAIRIYAEKPDRIHAVILDMTMPKLTGRETFRRLRAVRSGVKIIASSGYTQEGSVQELLKDGFHGFISKPYTIGQLARQLCLTLGDGLADPATATNGRKDGAHGQ